MKVILLTLGTLGSSVAFCPVPTLTGDRCIGKFSLRMGKSEGVDTEGNGPFTRKSLLEGAGKAAGVVGVGGFLRRGFVVGTPYSGTPDLTGKTAVITGGNTGLGKETAIRLAQLGADVTIACRNPEKASAAVEDIKVKAPEAKVSSAPLDLASLDSVSSFARGYSQKVEKLDILVNNAGVMAVPERQSTKEGNELQFGINHLGHFHLTSLLLPKVLKSPDGRVINVSSSAHMIPQSIDWEDLNAERPGAYGPWSAYGLSKLSNILFTRELQRRLDQKGAGPSTVTCMSLHPGACRTELGRYLFDPSQPVNPALLPLLGLATLVTRSSEEGAQTQICCAAEPSLGVASREGKGGWGGEYFIGPRITAATTALASDPRNAARMWVESEKLVGKFGL